jgi:hypothetical protein
VGADHQGVGCGSELRRGPEPNIANALTVRAENLNPYVLVMQPAKQGVRDNASDLLNRARDRSITVQ